MDNSQYANYNGQYAYPQTGYTGQQYAQSQQYQQPTPQLQIRNPFAPPPVGAGYGANVPHELDESQQLAQWHAQYAPAEEQDRSKHGGKHARAENANFAPLGQRGAAGVEAAEPAAESDGSRMTVVRKGGGQKWEDNTLLEWNPTHFRLMVGNLAGEVTDESLTKAFADYGVSHARVIRDKVTTKSKGYGFVSFYDGDQGFNAAREMVGKYIGSHPVTIERSKANLQPVKKKNADQFRKYGSKNRNKRNKNKHEKNDPLGANTGAKVEKKSTQPPAGMKVLG